MSDDYYNPNKLEVNIVSDGQDYQEIELIYGNKKKRKKITSLLPRNLASHIYDCPSSDINVTNLNSLSQFSKSLDAILWIKFIKLLVKINQMDEKNLYTIWDSERRLKTSQKAILLAVINSTRDKNNLVNRTVISYRSHEIKDQDSFKSFINEIIDLSGNAQKLAQLILDNVEDDFSDRKRYNLSNYIADLLIEKKDSMIDSKLDHLHRFFGEVLSGKEKYRSGF